MRTEGEHAEAKQTQRETELSSSHAFPSVDDDDDDTFPTEDSIGTLALLFFLGVIEWFLRFHRFTRALLS
jgi:hypothetical protein